MVSGFPNERHAAAHQTRIPRLEHIDKTKSAPDSPSLGFEPEMTAAKARPLETFAPKPA
jgi:hypothetical protein